MGMHLVNKAQEEFGYSILTWYKVLNLGYMCGWVPAGTLPPVDWEGDDGDGTHREWDGHYHSGEGQWITEADAANFAAALEAGLDDIPDIDIGESIAILPMRPHDDGELVTEDSIDRATRRYNKNPFEYFSGPTRKHRLREFIAFCRRGGFMVW